MKRILCVFVLTALLLCGCSAAAPVQTGNPLTGLEVMKALNIGWNLGNSFDAPGGETAWNNPVTTPELINRVKELGFDTIRIPISWGKHVSAASEYTIDAAYMERVDTVVNQALNAGLYVIIDVHHDNDIYFPDPENQERAVTYLNAVWSQIAEHFKDADYHLIYQTMNEPRIEGVPYEWGLSPMKKSHQAIFQVVNVLNQTALDAIRATGGRNADRFVVVCGYAGKTASTSCAYFRMPQDTVEGKLIVSAHIYAPYNLCMNLDTQFHSYSDSDEQAFRSELEQVKKAFVDRGIPVVVDEMGCTEKGDPEARYQWAKAFMTCADEMGIPCVWWDNGYLHTNGDNFGMINRRTLEIYPESQRVYEGLMETRVNK